MRAINYRRPRFMQPILRPVTLLRRGLGWNFSITQFHPRTHTHADRRVIASQVFALAEKKTFAGGFRISCAHSHTNTCTAHRSTPNLLSVAFNMLMAPQRAPAKFRPAADCQQTRTYTKLLILTSSDARMKSAAEAADVMGSKFSNSRPLSYALGCVIGV
jgi:hypothetical protein